MCVGGGHSLCVCVGGSHSMCVCVGGGHSLYVRVCVLVLSVILSFCVKVGYIAPKGIF